MSIHIDAKRGDIAEAVLLPGDPLRAKFIAETFLEDVVCYNEVRGMLGFTGTYRGQRISVQGTGMGMPSASIYITELIEEFGANQFIRIGTSGAIQHDVQLRDLIIAQGACTDSAMIRTQWDGIDYAPIANYELLEQAVAIAKQEQDLKYRVGNVFTTDAFYADNAATIAKLGQYGVLAVEMETAALYAISAKYGAKSLSITTASDHILTGEKTTPMERQTTFNQMIEVALKTMISL